MTLLTVRVPPEFEPQFAAVEQLVSRYFRDRRDDPAHGTIEIFGERYVLVRAASLSVEFFALVTDLYGPGRETEADEFARNILFDLAHAIGKSDAHNFHGKMNLTDPITRMSAGPVHFAHAGWAFVDISPESRPTPDEHFFLLFDHPYSFESDAWLRAGQRRDFPVCIMNAGYSSGWCEESFGVTLVATEVLCRARGDDCCRFVMAHPTRVEAEVERYLAGDTRTRAARPSFQIPDFFARKRSEEELRRTRDALEVRVAERTAALTAEVAERTLVERQLLQAQKLEAVGRLAGGIAHDFNNLLAVMIGNAELLSARVPADSPLRVYADEITATGTRAAALTRQLLTFSRANVLAREVLDVNQVVSELGRMLERVIGESVALSIRLGDGAGSVLCDRGQLEQVVMNLVVNARDAMPAGGRLTVETSHVELAAPRADERGTVPAGRWAVLAVRDTGIGMDSGTRAQIFDPFFTTKSAGKGSGLGLSTVYGIVHQSGGVITVESAPGEGARFAIYLPAAAPTPTPVEPPTRPTLAGGTETLLVVEDQDPLRAVVAATLRDCGYTVLEAGDAAYALDVAAAHAGPIHLLVTDVIMPRVGGPELARLLREKRPELRVLFMSGYTDDAQLGPDARLLAKPFVADALARAVREALGDPKFPG